MDYTTLIAAKTTAGSLANWGNHASIQDSASTIIGEAESAIYRRLRHWRMLTEVTGTLTVAQDYLTISGITNYLEDKTLWLNGLVGGSVYQQRVKRKTPEEVKQLYCFDGTGVRVQQTPQVFYNNGTQFKFDSPPDLAYPYELLFYQQPAALSGSNTTNWLTIYYPRLLRCALMAGVAEFMKDAGMGNYDRTYWEQNTETEIMVAQVESDRQSRSLQGGAYIE